MAGKEEEEEEEARCLFFLAVRPSVSQSARSASQSRSRCGVVLCPCL